MRIQGIKDNQSVINPTVLHQHKQLDSHVGENPDVNLVNISPDVSLRDQILAIQRVKSSLGVENLAASPLWDERFDTGCELSISEAKQIAEKASPKKGDICRLIDGLTFQLSGRYWGGDPEAIDQITHYLVKLLNKIDPDEISEIYNADNLFSLATNTSHTCGILISREVHNTSKINAAIATRIILKHDKSDSRDWREFTSFITRALASPLRGIRKQGAILAKEEYKRVQDLYYALEPGIISALKIEDDDNIRDMIASAIARSNPKSLLNSYTISGGGEPFIPLARSLSDRSLSVRTNLMWGVGNLLSAQRRSGRYYDDFQSIPELNIHDRVTIFDYTLKVIEQLYRKDNLSENELKLFHNSCSVLSESVDDKAIDVVNKITQLVERGIDVADMVRNDDLNEIKRQGKKEFERLVGSLARIDLLRLIKIASEAEFVDPTWKALNTWYTASPAVSRILVTRAEIYEKPLIHYFALRRDLDKVKDQTTNPRVSTNLSMALQRVDDAVENYITRIHTPLIVWGNNQEFNIIISDLLELLERTSKVSCRQAILSLFSNLNRDKLLLYGVDLEVVTLDKALNDINRHNLREALRKTVYLKPSNAEILISPPDSTLQGKALLLYRAYRSEAPPLKTYKDYYGMRDLKQTALSSAIDIVVSNRKASKGLLLSGEPGTGKSMFAVVLANEIALPLIVVKSSEIASGRNYFEEIKNAGCCVVLIDEVERIIPASSTNLKVLEFLQSLQELPVIKVATTNSPSTDLVEGMPINIDGTSDEIDKVLVQRVHPDCLKFMIPCYFFHRKSVGSDFAADYLRSLAGSKVLDSENDTGLVSNLGRGLIPFDIKTIVDEVAGADGRSGDLTTELGRLQLGRPRILVGAELIRRTLGSMEFEQGLKIDGPVDYKKLAFVAEDIPTHELREILDGTSEVVNQSDLLRLFCRHTDIDPGIIPILEKI